MQEFITFLSHHLPLSLAVIILSALIFLVEWLRARGKSVLVTPANAVQFINHDNAVVVDIRASDSYRQGHIIHAINLTPTEVLENPKKTEKFRTRPIIFVCQTGNESQKLAALLLKRSYNAYAMTGGMRAWIEAELPLIKE